ncbi:hypothetical protein [Exiguobacterium sp. K1]|uniref:hypothetical protein n=1 Tax=Exiguobacterium sp. K1 TaxID=2980105 RepID=UPI00299E12EC|nr:hypothetical protein [Exiguobacterium sp. K1]MDX1259992.1 hypothetical protein [Exiguobacterium sp. K1]
MTKTYAVLLVLLMMGVVLSDIFSVSNGKIVVDTKALKSFYFTTVIPVIAILVSI